MGLFFSNSYYFDDVQIVRCQFRLIFFVIFLPANGEPSYSSSCIHIKNNANVLCIKCVWPKVDMAKEFLATEIGLQLEFSESTFQ